MRYATGMRLDVYPTDAEAFEAAGALATEALRARPGTGPLAVALAGGRSGRGLLVALAARGDLPWERITWYWGDERCVPPDDAQSNVRLARESLLVPRAVPPARIVVPPVAPDDPPAMAAGYAAMVTSHLGPAPVFDLVLLGVGPRGEVASLMPGGAALAATAPIAAVAVGEVTSPPRLARITLTPPVLHAARQVLVVATGDAKAAIVTTVLRAPMDPGRVPAQLVLPSERVRWVVDRAAAAGLLRDAAVVPDAGGP